MPKPKQIFLLEVSYTGARPYRGPGGGIFRTERDMDMRIATIKSRRDYYTRNGIEVTFTVSVIDADWKHVSTEHYKS